VAESSPARKFQGSKIFQNKFISTYRKFQRFQLNALMPYLDKVLDKTKTIEHSHFIDSLINGLWLWYHKV
jgi:hypothetical protein